MNSQFEAIADGLATDGYAVVDQFLSPGEVDNILQLAEFNAHISTRKKAGIGSNRSKIINESIRGDYIQWLDRNSAPAAIGVYLHRLDELMQYVNRSLFLSLKDFEAHSTVYPAGSYYKRHLDQFKHTDHRKLSVICYLNTGWTEEHGGQLRLYLPEKSKDVFPVAGRLVCFRSDLIEHEVLPATRDRLSITGWLLDQLAELR